jgi:hypothetical protein
VVSYRYAVVAVLLFLLAPPCISADDLCELPQMRIDQRPGFGGEPTEITMGILVADITAIDDVAQTLTGDFITEISWIDN